jgi:predicted dehydrogenase
MSQNTESPSPSWPQSIAIAGAWGYIGRKYLDAAHQLGLTPIVFDPGPVPDDVPADRYQRIIEEALFYRQPADLFHLALQPEVRQFGLDILLRRSLTEPIAVLNEKPMAAPERPEACKQLVEAVESSKLLMLFDFFELFSPLTEKVVDYLSQFRQVTVETIEMHRSKDREDTANLRNYKRSTPIQYQESVHCLAWILFLLARLRGSLAAVFEGGLKMSAESEPYTPPNPQDYSYVVDGRCTWQLQCSGTRVSAITDFKRHAPWSKRRIVRGLADGQPFEIEAEYLEGKQQLVMNGVDQRVDPQANSYIQVLGQYSHWRRNLNYEQLLTGIYPNPRFAQVTYQLSSALWRASYDRRPLQFNSFQSLLGFDSGFAEKIPKMERYG